MVGSVFQLGRFQELLRAIRAGIQQPERAARSNDWYVAVTRLSADLATLAAVSGPAEAERKEIESGRITIGGATLNLNQDFVQSASLVSKELNVSERYAAFLVQEAALQESRWGRSAVEVACLLFHLEQQGALACLQELLEGLLLLRASADVYAAEAYKKVEGIVQDILVESASSNGMALPKRLLHFIDTENSSIERIDSTLRTGQLSFPEGFYTERVEWIQQNRKAAGTSLYLLAASRLLPSDAILEILRWLQKLPADGRDSLAVYILTTILAALDTISEVESTSATQITLEQLFSDKGFVTTAHAEITQKPWKHPDVKNVVLLAWAQVLALALPRSTALKAELGAKHSDPSALAQSAITAGDATTALGAFAFLQTSVLSFRQKVLDVLDGEYETAGDADAYAGDMDKIDAALGDTIGQDFQLEVLERVKAFCISTVDSFLPLLRKLQRIEEDAAYSTTRITQRPGSEAAERRHDIQALFDVIATVCRNRPDSGLRFCLTPEGRTSRFLNWALDVRDFGHEIGLFNMLISISAGPESAWIVHSIVLGAAGPSTDGRLTSWPRLFDWIQHYIDTFIAQPSMSRLSQQLLPENEAALLKSFLALLRNVVYYSEAALTAIYESQDFHALPRLFMLAQQRVPLQLRAALFDALAAFARPNHACADAVTTDLWTLLNSSHTVPAIGTRVQISGQYSIIEDLAVAESSEHTYPATTSFIRLLTALIQPFASGNSNGRGKTGTRPLSISESLAKRTEVTRSQDLTPYIEFVVSTVFLRHSDRDFRLHTERWRLVATCLQFMQECLRTFSLEGLFTVNNAGVEGAQNPQVLKQLIAHPGFEVMRRLLQDPKLGKEVLSILNPSPIPGYEAVDQHRAQTIFFAHSVRASMKILIQALRLQSAFLELLLPAAGKVSGLAHDALSKVGNIASYSSFDLQLQRNHESVVQIALFVLCEQQDIATLSAQLLGLIAETDFFSTVDQVTLAASRRSANRLVGLLEVSEEAQRVRAGAVRQLLRDPAAAEVQLDTVFEDNPLAPPTLETTLSSVDRTKLAILNLVQEQISASRPFPNLGHLLLGFDCHSSNPEDAFVPSATQDDQEYGILHAVVDLMTDSSNSDDAPPLSNSVAERALAIITDLCRNTFTAEATLRFLRRQGNFFAKMLQSFSLLPVEQNERRDNGEIVWADGTRIITSETAVLLSLKMKAHLLEGFALEVHSLLSNNTPHLASDLVQALFVKSGAEGEYLGAQSVSGKRASLIALLDSLDFEWHDERRVHPDQIPLLEEYADMFAVDARYSTTLSSLLLIQQDLQKKGRFFDAKIRPQFEREAAILLAAASGHEAQLHIVATKRLCVVAWRTCLSVVLASSRSIMRADIRGLVAFDILTAVLARLNNGSVDADDAQMHEIMSGATLDLVTVVRQHCEESVPALATTGALGGIASERLVATFKETLLGMVRPATFATGRANLYSAAVNFLHLLRAVASAGIEGDADVDDTTMRQDQDSVGNVSTVLGSTLPSTSTVAAGVRSILNACAESLVPIVAKDALDADDAWKTVAFTFLAQICGAELSMGSSRLSSTLDILARQGYLSNFVSNLRQRDSELQEALAPIPSALAPLYVYQALFSLLTRLAHLRDGLVRLVDIRIFDAISSLDVLDLRPSDDDMLDNGDDFFPAVLERYHEVVLPALQLCSILANRAARSYAAVGSSSDGSGQVTTVLKAVYALVDAHQDTFTYALRVVTQDSVFISQLQMATLLVKLLTSVLPVIGQDLHSKGYLPYHSTVTALLSTFLCSSSWRGKIVPSTAAELQAAQDPAPASSSYTRFDAEVDLAVARLNGALLAYSAAATSMNPTGLNPMVVPSLARPESSNGAVFMPRATNTSLARSISMRPSSMASLGTLVASLEEHATTLEDCAAESDKILLLLESHQAWVSETCAEILGTGLEQVASMSIGLLRSKALQRLRVHQRFVRALVILKLDAVEILLVLLLRHFAFYLNPLPNARENDKSTSTTTTGLDRMSIRREGAVAVNEVIERLSVLTLPGSILPGTESRHALIQMAARRLQAITVEQDTGG
ncbi:unnamed protein product [Tilletia controversa]|uniref:Nucleoporin n=3 Tax=Tilletia TaxID=13289 RepID=A0A8X7SUK1_9BASI|nr:hypothetical protein CF336_g6703 [Tilletia laevis]KAE8189417.1 hypothetical protein CF328_g6291 [Tilletia controversa]KAE8252492.1 hypothetical protein A4X03_0g6149 [Tilletia caries]KAE8191205.1 hypothetical protein CF335_g6148 [Tilletia laevis]KAE8242171.1 hypothetical protein A4X06_0g7166 [Tilletia controversa]